MIGLLKFWREALIVGLVLAVAGQQVRVVGEKSAHQKTKADNAEVLRVLAVKTLEAYQAVVAEDDARKAAVAALDEKHTKELNHEKRKLETLQSDVRAGRVGLRVNASCAPAAGTGVPSATGAASVVDATGPRLTDAAKRDYFALRTRVETSRQQIAGLQDYVRDACLK